MRKALLISLAVVITMRSSTAQQPSTGYEEDLRLLRSELEQYHPGLNWYWEQGDMEDAFAEAVRMFRGSTPDEMDFYRTVRKLVAEVRCGHTRCRMPQQSQEDLLSSERVLPLSLSLVEGRLLVDEVLPGSALQRGDELLQINGNSGLEALDVIMSYQSGDGLVLSGRRRTALRVFPLHYSVFVESGQPSYDLLVRRDDKALQLRVDGASWVEVERLGAEQRPREWLSITHEEDFSTLRIGTFSQGAIQSGGQDFSDFLRKAFLEIEKREVSKLVVDLRGNGGGRDNYGAELVSYLVPESFGYFQEIVVTPAYQGYGGIKEEDGRRFVTTHSGLDRQDPSENAFEGSLYVLIDGGSFSTCADVASVLKANERKFLVGEETGGGARGNTSGNTKTLTLPYSEITVFIPLWKYTTALAERHPEGRGVAPDIEISPTIQQFLESRDAVMDYVRAQIAKEKG